MTNWQTTDKLIKLVVWVEAYLIIAMIIQLVIMSKHMERQDQEMERIERLMIKNFNHLNKKTAPFKVEPSIQPKPNQSFIYKEEI